MSDSETNTISHTFGFSSDARRVLDRGLLWFCILMLIGVGVARYVHPHFSRNIEIDERITIQEYTWAGVLNDGSRNELRMHDQIKSIRGCSPRRFVIGCWASLGRWTEPNNHILHSLMVNLSMAVIPDTLRAIRLPALLAAIGFSACCAAMCIRAGWLWTAPLVTVLSLFHPYVIEYSQSSRGYALMLFLCTLTLFLVSSFFQNPNRRWISVGLVATLIALFLTIVSMVIDWVVPTLVAMGAYIFFVSKTSQMDRKALFSSWAIQSAFVMYAACFFILDRLPYLISSASQYGIPFSNVNELRNVLGLVAIYLAPTWGWAAFFCCGFVGFLVAVWRRNFKPIVFTLISVALISLMHFVGGGKFPYERNMGYFLIPAIFGFATLLSVGLARTKSSMQWTTVYLGGWGVVLWAVGSSWIPRPDLAYLDMIDKIRNNQVRIAEDDVLIMGRGSSELSLYLNWDSAQKSHQRQLVILENRNFPIAPQGLDGGSIGEKFTEACGRPKVGTEHFSLWVIPITLNERGARSDHLQIAVWRVPFAATSVSPEPVLQELREHALPFLEINERFQAKMDVYQRLAFVVVPIFGTERVPELQNNRYVLEQVVSKIGGELMCYTVNISSELSSESVQSP